LSGPKSQRLIVIGKASCPRIQGNFRPHHRPVRPELKSTRRRGRKYTTSRSRQTLHLHLHVRLPRGQAGSCLSVCSPPDSRRTATDCRNNRNPLTPSNDPTALNHPSEPDASLLLLLEWPSGPTKAARPPFELAAPPPAEAFQKLNWSTGCSGVSSQSDQEPQDPWFAESLCC
jgi:hypothetical protein